MLSRTMDHLLAGDVLLGEQGALPLAAGGNYSAMRHAVFYFSSICCDKLWQGAFVCKPSVLYDFVYRLIGQIKRKGM